METDNNDLKSKIKRHAINVIYYGVLLGISLATTYWVFSPLWKSSEIYFILRLITLCFIVSTFGLLRVYNAIKGNTRFVILLREAILKVQKDLPTLTKAIQTASAKNVALQNSLKELIKQLESFKNKE